MWATPMLRLPLRACFTSVASLVLASRSGKSSVLVHAATRAAERGDYVLILCPTGTLVHSYRDLLPHSERIILETIHSSFCISRRADMLVQ